MMFKKGGYVQNIFLTGNVQPRAVAESQS